MKRIQLTKGYDAIVDDDVYDEVRNHRWHASTNSGGNIYYAKSSILGSLHRFVMTLYGYDIEGKVVDHINHDTLDNRRDNLRVIHSRRENTRNQKSRKMSKHSQYTGVSFRDHAKRWGAKLRVYGKEKFLGYYDTAEDAGLAYDRAVLYYFPEENTVLNFPDKRDEHDLSKPYERQYKKVKSTNKSGYRGVSIGRKKNGDSYRATIGFGGRKNLRKIHLGTFDNPKEAAYIYDLAQIVLHRVREQDCPKEYRNFPRKKYTTSQMTEMFQLLEKKGAF